MPEFTIHPVLARAAARLRCPNCGGPLRPRGRALACARGHSHDIARQGYVSLLPPRHRRHPGDPAGMVAARAAFLATGHYAPIADAVAQITRDCPALGVGAPGRPGWVVDLGAGTGYHLARVLDALDGWSGIALDASRPALRRAVRAHPGIAGVAADLWRPLPLRDAAADLAINVFAPRNGQEIARVLAPGGALVVVTPAPHHLRELARLPGMLRVPADKRARLLERLPPALAPVRRRDVALGLRLSRADVRALVTMGPSAHHVAAADLDALPAWLDVTAAVVVDMFVRASGERGIDRPRRSS